MTIDPHDRWTLPTLDQSDTSGITDLLIGRTVAMVDDEHLRLDDGTLLRVIANQGGCACSAGDYDLTELNGIDNVITRVEFDYQPTDDETPYEPGRPQGHYRIFVYAENRKVNLLTVEGDDGNGYYGTGFEIIVKRPVTQS